MTLPQSPVGTTVTQTRSEPGCLIQILWFLFVGWWLGGIAVSLAWFLNVIILGLPLGMAILNNIPKIIALQEPRKRVFLVTRDGRVVLREDELPQRPFLLRLIFFVLIGWWWSGVWMGFAYALCATVILLPIGLELFRYTPFMTTLKRY